MNIEPILKGQVYCSKYGNPDYVCIIDTKHTDVHFSCITKDGIHPMVSVWDTGEFIRSFDLQEDKYIVGYENTKKD